MVPPREKNSRGVQSIMAGSNRGREEEISDGKEAVRRTERIEELCLPTHSLQLITGIDVATDVGSVAAPGD
jgi:hypothetical protein